MKIPELKKLKSILSRNGNPQPQRDWLYIIAIGITALLVSAFWSYWSALTPNSAPSTDGNTKKVQTQTNVIETVQTIFEKRANEREKFQKTYNFVDPSR